VAAEEYPRAEDAFLPTGCQEGKREREGGGLDCGCGERVESATGRNQYVLTVRNTFEPLYLQVTRSW